MKTFVAFATAIISREVCASTLLSEQMMQTFTTPDSIPDMSSKIIDGFAHDGGMSGNLGGNLLLGQNDANNGRYLRSSLLEASPGAAVSMINLLGSEGFGADGPTNFMGDSSGISSLAAPFQSAMQMSPFPSSASPSPMDIGSSPSLDKAAASMFPTPTDLSALQHDGMLPLTSSQLAANAEHTAFALAEEDMVADTAAVAEPLSAEEEQEQQGFDDEDMVVDGDDSGEIIDAKTHAERFEALVLKRTQGVDEVENNVIESGLQTTDDMGAFKSTLRSGAAGFSSSLGAAAFSVCAFLVAR